MITKEEFLKIARKKGFRNPQVAEKDYALTWALKAIYENEKLAKYLVFKGGTCLSKVYAQNYRMSEDLDFSTYREGKLTEAELESEIEKAFEAANKNGAPTLSLKKEDTHINPGLVTLRAKYIGPLGNPNSIKIEVSLKEQVIYDSELLPVNENNYPDITPFKIHCYHFLEMFVEKLRAIMQRGKSRDYYDVWQMLKRKPELRKRLPTILHEGGRLRKLLYDKCEYNRVPYEPEKMFSKERLDETERYWKQGLENLVSELPDFRKVIEELKEEDLFEEAELARLAEQAKSTQIFDADPLLNVARGEHAYLLLIRGFEILHQSLKSNKRKEVLWALEGLSEMNKRGHIEQIKKVRGIAIDIRMRADEYEKDDEIRLNAKKLLEALKI